MRKLAGASAIALIALAAAFGYACEPSLDRISRPDKSSFDAETIRRGEQLAAVGDCIVCHTADGGAPFAGARPLSTPFGTLYSTNITPDETTGIGAWSQEAFIRAMQRGVSRDGRHLYPALPYEHFTRVADDDLRAIYTFLMTRRAVVQEAPANELLPGLGFRPLLAGWKLLFLHEGDFEPALDQTAEWNRGKYLVDGLGHCGGCHTPRNLAGGEEHRREFAGGVAEGWIAPALDGSNPSASQWSVNALHAYLKRGFAKDHGAAGGPMGPVSEGLSGVSDSDVTAIAVYIASVMQAGGVGPATAIDKAGEAAEKFPEGASLFAGACAGCHEPGSPMSQQQRPSLSALTTMKMADPANAALTLVYGIPTVPGKGPLMPSYGQTMTNKELAALLAYVRARFTDKPAWDDLEAAVAAARSED
ncbi:diheme cytochrome c-type (plasmid) [Ensifer adhaerens OV14]|nr:diheme cytochrome c-type [Ensifer adhaerens OV14]